MNKLPRNCGVLCGKLELGSITQELRMLETTLGMHHLAITMTMTTKHHPGINWELPNIIYELQGITQDLQGNT